MDTSAPRRASTSSLQSFLRELPGILKDLPIGLLDIIIHYSLRLVPIDWCSHVGVYLGLFARIRYPASDARARRAWQTLRPDDADDKTTEAALVRLWRCVGRTMAEYSVLGRLLRAGRIEVVGAENMQVPDDRPRLVMGLHLGNWETIPPALYSLGYGMGQGIYLPPENRFDHWVAVQARKTYGARLVPPGPNATRVALKALKEKSGFFIFVDEFVRGRVHAPSFGRPHELNGSNIAYVARLAAMTNAVVIPTYAERLGDEARFRVHILPPLELKMTSNKKADVAENVARIDALIDPIIRKHLDQWFYVLDFDFDK